MQHNCTRYLIFFQYLGTKYSGVMKIPAHQPVEGVQNHIENAVRRLKPLNEVSLYISSRTDTGVHALCNSAHLDIQRKDDKPPFTGKVLTDALNLYLKKEPIRITRAYRVSNEFHARHSAISRTYVYRLATGLSSYSDMPITEKDLCWALRDTKLDISAMEEASAVLTGTHDFSTFQARGSDPKNPVKTMERVQVQPGLSFSQCHFNRDIEYWELSFKCRSYLYKQVRRMTGALVAVGQGKLSVRQMQKLLDARDSLAYPQNMCAPACGLYLTKVEYNDSDLLSYTPDDTDIRS
ncbi:tRNA pseudouridine synthase-like 1 isoform X3 [Astyanax mexicanus]|uniref:tRNA pseudouridine synthase-like 1 isoform X3 n=1 Tax=Astyanax mexicanus TaxID=7994 RepID=UPI0020CAF051|nr:tRNA pseudouridine synthase-like 1 isoform X3 [Astyanax mexicanus]